MHTAGECMGPLHTQEQATEWGTKTFKI